MINVIYPNRVLDARMIVGTESDAYPIANISDDHPTLPGKTNESTATVRLSVGGGADSLFFCNTNLATVRVHVLDGGENTVSDTTHSLRDNATCYWELMTGRRPDGSALQSRTSLWVSYPIQASSHYVDLTFETVEPAISVGVVKCGPGEKFPHMKYGVKESLIDYSIEQKLIRGENIIMGDIVTAFQIRVKMDRQNQFWKFSRKIAKRIGARPLAWKLSDTDTREEWEVYAKFSPLPTGDHYNHRSTNTTYGLEEVV